MQRRVPLSLTLLTAAYALLWSAAFVDWKWVHSADKFAEQLSSAWIYGVIFATSLPLGLAWVVWTLYPHRLDRRFLWGVLSIGYVFWWQAALFLFETLGWESTRVQTARYGTFALFMIGLIWVVWGVEKAAQVYRARRREWLKHAGITKAADWSDDYIPETWNPLDPEAVYYGKRQPRLNQSLLAFVSYSFVFFVAFLIITRVGGCAEEYEMPPGGGEQQQIAQKIKIQKVIRRKFVLNPLSSIIYEVPPIEEVRLNINDVTKHAYKVGYGKGAGAGFGGGSKGKVRFIRLEYDGGDWNQGMGIGADMNMLLQYNLRTKTKIAKKTESMRISRLKNFKPTASPPMVYMTGQRGLSTSKSDERILRDYLLERHGMIFASAGSAQFHSRFMALMSRLLPTVRPVAVPLDDPIHKRPYAIPFFPYVAAHGGKQALGWKVEGRWVVYYHPGDIGDAWADGHSGVRPDVWEACYQLGTNVINYAHYQHAVWRKSRGGK